MARLGDICTISSSTENIDSKKVWLLNLDMVEQQTGRVIDYLLVNKNDLTGSIVQFSTDNVLYSKLRPNLNKVVIPNCSGFATSEMLPLKPNTNILTKEYLTAFLRSDTFVTWASSKTAGAKMPRLSSKELLNKEIPLPPLFEQQHIAAVLDKVSELIDLRKMQLVKLDELVKSRFVEMFGDQGNNSLGFTVGKLSDVAEIFLGLTHTPTYVESGKPFLSVRDISSGSIDFSACHYITEEEFKSLPNGARPHVGDMLFCRVGTIGKPVIIPTGTPEFGTFVSIGYLRKKDNVNNLYLKSWMENEYFMKQVYDNVAGASQINLNTGWLKNFRILIPPIELQNQFAAFVEQIDMQKSTIQQSLGKLETLKKALMQEYFG